MRAFCPAAAFLCLDAHRRHRSAPSAASAGGERLAGVSNDGRLEVFREVRSQLTKKAFARTLEGVGMPDHDAGR